MRPHFEVLTDLLVGRRIEDADRSVTVADIDALCDRIVAQLVGIIGKLHGIDYLISLGIEDFAGAIAFTGDHDTVQVGKVRHHLRLDESFLEAALSPTTRCIEDFHAVIPVNGSENPAAAVIHRHVVKTAYYFWDRDNANQDEWGELVGRQLLRHSADGKQQG